MKLKILAVAALAFSFLTGNAQTDLQNDTKKLESSKIPLNPNVKKGTLENGLTYYIQNNGKPADKLELRLVVNAGSILETEDQLGLAHFMEHMNFNGTKNFQKNELVDYLQSIGVKFGADLNAYTSFDETVYILPIPSDDSEKLEKGFQILEDWAHNATLTDEAIDDERGVVLEEYRLGLGPNKRMMQEYLPKLMYGSQYAKRLPIGTKENLDNFEYKDVRDYYKNWYRPDLMAVIAVGDLDPSELEAKIKKHFGGIAKPKSPKKREEFSMPNHEETLVAIASDTEAPFTQIQIVYKDKFKAPTIETVADFKDDLAKDLFATMINNRLTELTNSPNPPFVFGFSYYGGTFARGKNAYQSVASTSETGQLEGLKALLEENERVKQYGFQPGEFDRAKAAIMARLEKSYNDRDKQESNRIIGQYVQNYLDDAPAPGVAWQYETTKTFLPTIKLEDVSKLINTFIHDDNRVIILTGPEKDALKKVTEAEVLKLLKDVQNSKIEPYKDNVVRKDLVEKLQPKGSITNTQTNTDIGFTTLTLSNGAKVIYKKTDFKNDEVLFEAFSFGGNSLYSDKELLATNYANGGINEAGIGGLSKTDLSKMMSGKIASVSPSIGLTTENLRGQAAPKDLETLFQMVYLYFTDVNKDAEAYQSFISKQKSFLANIMSNPNFYFSDQIDKFQNQGNPRYIGFPSVEDLDAADYDLAYTKFLERFEDAGDFNFYFVGNVDEVKLKEFSEKYIASLPTTNSNETFNPTTFRRKDIHQKKVIYKGADPKSMVNITWREDDVPYNEEEKVLVEALGEVLTIKLIEKLREEEGGVYGAGANGNFRKLSYPGVTFSISFPCGPENVDKLVAAALAEVEKIKADGPTQKDVDKVKEAVLVENKENLEKNNFWMQTLVTAATENRPIHTFVDAKGELETITAKGIQKVAVKYLDDNYFLGILMPEEK
ncbi:M16 family metallopeptidase [Rasiella sp. SM2506]|uniref:M16 family metallopeptidase n=1 Tax=Rasiella sp. SM2506 TaxID=3423914 RepID=UPI003D7A88DC